MRRVLLAAHVLPAVFGLVAVLAPSGPARALDVAVWSFVLAWSLGLAFLGWTRSARTTRLTAWVVADATVMAALMFVGTSARSVASYVAVDGALFAAVFVSAPVALAQVGIAYSGVVAAVIARANGSEIPTPIQGWQTPIIVTLAGILALRFLRSALDRLGAALRARHDAVRRERELLAEATAEEAVARDVVAIEREVAPALGHLEALSRRYAAVAVAEPTRAEARWLLDCLALVRGELATLQHVLEPPAAATLDDLIDGAIRGASAARLAAGDIRRVLAPRAAAVALGPTAARAVAGFVREAVTNALFHGGTPIAVAASLTDDGELRIGVRDAGPGYEATDVAAGIGLLAMRDHAAAAGGHIAHHPAAPGRPHEVALVLGGVG